MDIRPNQVFPRAPFAALALAASLLSVGATSAKAQWFNWDSGLQPMQVERMIEASGYRLTGPVMRNGPVYLANVLGREDDRERLVIDARDGRLLQRYGAAAARRQAAVAGDWSRPPRPQALFDGLFGHDDDFPPPRPPADVYGDSGARVLRVPLVPPAPQVRASQSGQVARADDDASPSAPYVIPAPPAAAHAPALERPRLRAQIRHKKPESTPLAQPAAAPANEKPAPVAAVQPTANPQPPANPPAAMTPNVAPPATAHAPVAAAPRVAEKTVVAPAPQAAPTAPPPKAAPSKSTLNDVPVAPLE